MVGNARLPPVEGKVFSFDTGGEILRVGLVRKVLAEGVFTVAGGDSWKIELLEPAWKIPAKA